LVVPGVLDSGAVELALVAVVLEVLEDPPHAASAKLAITSRTAAVAGLLLLL
jgi:hypothetical protein